MRRLLPEALMGNELSDLHMLREDIAEGRIDPWKGAAKRAKEYDPDGSKSLALLRKMQLDYKTQ